jgi:hypothetical protein
MNPIQQSERLFGNVDRVDVDWICINCQSGTPKHFAVRFAPHSMAAATATEGSKGLAIVTGEKGHPAAPGDRERESDSATGTSRIHDFLPAQAPAVVLARLQQLLSARVSESGAWPRR